jgi:hypothetical protein
MGSLTGDSTRASDLPPYSFGLHLTVFEFDIKNPSIMQEGTRVQTRSEFRSPSFKGINALDKMWSIVQESEGNRRWVRVCSCLSDKFVSREEHMASHLLFCNCLFAII